MSDDSNEAKGSVMNEDMGEKIRNRMMVDENTIIEQLLEEASKYIQLDSLGRIYLRNVEKLRAIDLIALVLLGKRLAKEAKLVPNEFATIDQIVSLTGLKEKVITARLSELKKDGIIESESRGQYGLIMGNMRKVLSEINRIKSQEGGVTHVSE